MSKDTRFKPGQSGNPAGRPKQQHPPASSFDVILDKRLTVVQNGKARELTVEEALQQQVYKDALAGKSRAIGKILKMIHTRDAALAKPRKKVFPVKNITLHYSAENANDALRILGIADPDERVGGCRWNIHTWATQAALSRPGRKRFSRKDVKDITFFTFNADTLRWPRGRIHDD